MSKAKKTPPPDFFSPRRQAAAVCGLLLLAVGLVFGQTVGYGFCSFDDGIYITSNFHVLRGFSWENIVWAFTTDRGSVWVPITWLSFMADGQFWGNNPAGYHLMNVLIHGAASVCLFLAFRSLTGQLWPSAFVAAIFAIHPLQVESVAWVTERKDVLSGLFFMLTLWAYAGYARRPQSWLRYLTVLVLAALGMMAKAMLMTLPMVLLLLDYWPLGRFSAVPVGDAAPSRFGRWATPLRLVAEKIPLFAMTVVVGVMATYSFEKNVWVSYEKYPMFWRIGNAFLCYSMYLRHFFCPMDLAFVYPRLDPDLPWVRAFGALVVLLGIAVAVVMQRRRFPYLMVGWFWFLGILVPVIGLLQVGSISAADRYTYLPIIGLATVLAWGAADALKASPHRRVLSIAASTVILAALMLCAFGQTLLWRDNETLWLHTLGCTTRNFFAHANLGNAFVEQGRAAEALEHYKEASRINSGYFTPNFGLALAMQGEYEKGIQCYRKALEDTPDVAKIHFNLAWIYATTGRRREAIASYRRAIELASDDRESHNNLGVVLLDDGQYAEAMKEFQEAIHIGGEDPNIAFNMGNALVALGRFDEAIEQYRKVLAVSPDDAEAKKKLAEAERSKNQSSR